MEASKVSTGNMTVDLTKTDAFEIINQAAGEYKERFEDSDLEFILRNSTGRDCVYITAEEDNEAVISFKNISKKMN